MVRQTAGAADYRITAEAGGNRYSFYCGISGARICTTGVVHAQTQVQELELAWTSEGKKYFNRCKRCGRWVCDSMYNPDVLGCVECYPVISFQKYCMRCGRRIREMEARCSRCGADVNLGSKRGWRDKRDVLHMRNLRHCGFGADAMKSLKLCPKCKSITGASNRACRICGEALCEDTLYQHYTSISRRCEACAAIVTREAKYCPQCGKRLMA